MAEYGDFWLRPGLLDPKHCQVIGEAVWLYLYAHRIADYEKGDLNYKHEEAAKALGVSTRTIKRWFAVLVQGKYIEAKRLQYGFYVQITKWIPQSERARMARERKANKQNRSDTSGPSGSDNNGLSEDSRSDKNGIPEVTKSVSRSDTSGPSLSLYTNNQTNKQTISSNSNESQELKKPAKQKKRREPTDESELEKGKLYGIVKTVEEALGYEKYENRNVAYKQAKMAIQSNPSITSDELAECVKWMLETNGDFWGRITVQIATVVKQLPAYRKAKAQGWYPGKLPGRGYQNGNGKTKRDNGPAIGESAEDYFRSTVDFLNGKDG